MIRRLSFAAAGLAVATLLAGCGGMSGSAPTASNPEGTWGEASKPYLTLTDGSFTGNDGCNGMSGTYTIDGERLLFSQGATTLMACLGVDTWLSNAATATVSIDTMTLYDTDGAEIGTLARRS